MKEIALQSFISIALLIATVAWGGLLLKALVIEDQRVKGLLSVLFGILIWAVFSIIFFLILGISANSFRVILGAATVVMAALTFRNWSPLLLKNPVLVVFVFILSLIYNGNEVPGHNKLYLGDASEYLQIARNIAGGMGYVTNFLIADHFGADTIIRPVYNRMPLLPLELAALGELVGYKPWLIDMIVAFSVGSCLSFFADFSNGWFKKLLIMAVPFVFYNQIIFIWSSALEWTIAAYLLPLCYLAFNSGRLKGFRGWVVVAVLEAGILYGGNGIGPFILLVCSFSVVAVIIYHRVFKTGLAMIGFHRYLAFFLLLPLLILTPWILRTPAEVRGNLLYNIMSYDESMGIQYGRMGLMRISEEIKEKEAWCGQCNPSNAHVLNPYTLNFLISYHIFNKDPKPFQDLLDNHGLMDFLLKVPDKIAFFKTILLKAFDLIVSYHNLFWANLSVYMAVPAAIIFVIALFYHFRAIDVVFFSSLSAVAMFSYIIVLCFLNEPQPRMLIPFLMGQLGVVAALISKVREPGWLGKSLVVFILISASGVFCYKWRSELVNEDNRGVLEAAEWIRNNTNATDLLYADPPQLFTYLTSRMAVGTSWSYTFLKLADDKFKPDYFIINNYRTDANAYYRVRDYVKSEYKILVDNPDKKYLIFTSKTVSAPQ
ncbi:MAG: hypothetical protein HY880_02970 [Deltaproteobacteria bacterium]|nr:hypothetical protein [Deltaproteobacteria bacterium]